jgi:hypothetical protein
MVSSICPSMLCTRENWDLALTRRSSFRDAARFASLTFALLDSYNSFC